MTTMVRGSRGRRHGQLAGQRQPRNAIRPISRGRPIVMHSGTAEVAIVAADVDRVTMMHEVVDDPDTAARVLAPTTALIGTAENGVQPSPRSTTLLLIGLLLTGCVSLPNDYPRTPSTAFQDYRATELGRFFEEDAVQHPAESGFALMRYGREAFTARIMLTELAGHSLVLQYYIWEPDATGRIFAERVIRAADRGVRVRVLVDDIGLAGRDALLATIDAHPNIEIRIFNPFANRGARIFDFLADFDRVNHRMHNKSMIADNAVAIVGGRNVGDIYFQVGTDANYRDLDIPAAGPIVRDISKVYDYFWNSEWAVPIEVLAEGIYVEADLQQFRQILHQRIEDDDYPYPLDQDVEALRRELAVVRDELTWALGQIVWNDPATVAKAAGQQAQIVQKLSAKLDTLQDELLVESAYFVVRQPYVDKLGELHDRGVRVRVLTNSLASNDVIAAHAGHAKHRHELIENGVELYEMRPDAGVVKRRVVSSDSRAGLHGKAMVFDREAVFVGSFNLDPRSTTINTEAGLYVESPELAEELGAFMDEGVRPENSYRVLLGANGDLVWVTERDGGELRYTEEPGSTLGNRFMTDLIMMLPVEGQL